MCDKIKRRYIDSEVKGVHVIVHLIIKLEIFEFTLPNLVHHRYQFKSPYRAVINKKTNR